MNSVTKINSKLIYFIMIIAIMNSLIFEKPAPSFFLSEPIPPPHPQEANILSL